MPRWSIGDIGDPLVLEIHRAVEVLTGDANLPSCRLMFAADTTTCSTPR